MPKKWSKRKTLEELTKGIPELKPSAVFKMSKGVVSSVKVQCDECGAVWEVKIQEDGKLPDGWFVCPECGYDGSDYKPGKERG
ncbi:hypothetical protein ES703_44664 [subsurface metagenome]